MSQISRYPLDLPERVVRTVSDNRANYWSGWSEC
jgi:hypothetical protein